jgi:Xaa-Pro aminopeptidase
VAEIRRSAALAERALATVRHLMLPERTERQVAAELEYQMRQFGAKGAAFETIVATGARAALPHARPGDQRIGSGEFTLVDWGATGGLYRSDLTRLVVTSRISPKLKRVYGVVLEAQRQAIAAIRPGVAACDVDRVAREVIAGAGYGRYFGHSLGHGIGLDIHEGPRLIKTNKRPLKPGNVVTVEPGIYLPGWGGVRIEDDVLVTRSGCEVLTRFPKQLEEAVL